MRARALSIAGFDPTAGAGVLQDVRTFEACGVWGLAVVTAVTAQDTMGIHAWEPVSAGLARSQIEKILADARPTAIKTGMLASADTVKVVADLAGSFGAPLVVDPVVRASTGGALGYADVLDATRTLLLPVATVVTPNIIEAGELTGIAVSDDASMRDAARALVGLGSRAAIITGGHLGGDESVDLLLDANGEFHELLGARLDVHDDHGTGCVFSSALAAFLARGEGLVDAARRAKGMVTRALSHAERFGEGRGPVHPVAEERPWPLAGHPFE